MLLSSCPSPALSSTMMTNYSTSMLSSFDVGSPVLVVVDGKWLTSPLNSSTLKTSRTHMLGSDWSASHRVDYRKMNTLIQKQLSQICSTSVRIVKSVVLVEGVGSDLVEGAVEDMAASDFEVCDLKERTSTIDAASMCEVFDLACIITGDLSFAQDVLKKHGMNMKVYLVSIRNACDNALKTNLASTIWLEDHLTEFVTPFPFFKKAAPLPPRLSIITQNYAYSPEFIPSPPPSIPSFQNPVMPSPAYSYSKLPYFDLPSAHDDVLLLIRDFVASNKYTFVSSRTIGRFLSSKHPALLDILKTRLGGLKSFVRSHPELFTTTTSEDGKEFGIVMASQSQSPYLPTRKSTIESFGSYGSTDEEDKSSETHHTFPPAASSNATSLASTTTQALGKTDSVTTQLVAAAIELQLNVAISWNSSQVEQFLMAFPVQKHTNALSFVVAEYGSLVSFLQRRADLFVVIPHALCGFFMYLRQKKDQLA